MTKLTLRSAVVLALVALIAATWASTPGAHAQGGDRDGDGIPDGQDNCPNTPNPGQEDSNRDGTGDACEDSDGDGILDAQDNCLTTFNPGQEDSDGDQQGDACDPDDDNDGVADFRDNCDFTQNPGQENSDGDDQGDACDPDDDNDGVLDIAGDNCPTTPNPRQEDFDRDAQGDACDEDDDNDGITDAEDDCPREDARGRDLDRDGCIDTAPPPLDSDGDGVLDPLDRCPRENARGRDADGDGCIDPVEPPPTGGNPMNVRIFVDEQWHPAWRLIRGEWGPRLSGGEKNLIRRIAEEPQADWGWCPCTNNRNPGAEIGKYLARVRQTDPGSVAAITIYELKHEACGGYHGGGRRAVSTYKRRLSSYARGIGRSRIVIFLEPDGLGTTLCLSRRGRSERFEMVRHAVAVLSRLPNTTVYIDAGAADWRTPAQMATLLRRADVRKVRGFALNVTHYDWTDQQVDYGLEINRLLARRGIRNKHFVINTAYNGRGPRYVFVRGVRRTVWCNPPGRALGRRFTTRTAHPAVDAYFWIGGPGFSNGRCRGFPGSMRGPNTGTFWIRWALQLARTPMAARERLPIVPGPFVRICGRRCAPGE